jgi:hypothetical protein
VKSDCVLEILGQQVSLPLNIGLKKGWNIISFPFINERNASDILQPLIDAGILVKVLDESGNSFEYWDPINEWVNRIGNFKAGEGYMVEVNADGVLPLSNSYTKSGLQLVSELNTEYFLVDYEGNGINHMNINILDLDKTGLQVGDEIAAFDGSVCVGAVKLSEIHFENNMVSIDASSAEDDQENGFIEGNSIELMAWNKNQSEEVKLTPTIIQGEIVFEKHASVFLELQIYTSLDVQQGINTFEIDMYPNPARNKVTVRFSELPEVGSQIIIMDLSGKQIVTKLVESDIEVLDIQSYPTGIYLIKTIIGDEYKVFKLIKN